MNKPLIQSSIVHFSILALLMWAPLFNRHPSVIWLDSFDFMGGGGGGGGGGKGKPGEDLKKSQVGQVVPQPIKEIIPAKPAPVQQAQKAEESWSVKNKNVAAIAEKQKTEESLPVGEKVQKEQSNVIRRGIGEGTTAGEGQFDYGQGPGSGGGIGGGIGPGIGIGVGPGSGGGFGFGAYLKILRNRIWQEWNQSAVFGDNQMCIVGMTVMASGDVRDIKIEKTSGNPFYDQVALRAVRNSSPLQPLPPNFPEREQRFRIQFKLQE